MLAVSERAASLAASARVFLFKPTPISFDHSAAFSNNQVGVGIFIGCFDGFSGNPAPETPLPYLSYGDELHHLQATFVMAPDRALVLSFVRQASFLSLLARKGARAHSVWQALY